jgi:hypothetical protein
MKQNLSRAAVILAVLVLATAVAYATTSKTYETPGDISRAQTILEMEGYLAPGSYTNGKLDTATQLALQRYQNAHTLNNTGALDDKTFQTLLSHEMSYPWSQQTPLTVAAEEPVAPAPEPRRVEEPVKPKVAEAPAVPEEKPTTVAVRQAPEPPAPEPAMPATASPLGALVFAGLALIGSGAALLRIRRG